MLDPAGAHGLAAIRGERPDLAGGKVGEEIFADEIRKTRAAIDEAAGDGNTVRPRIAPDWIAEPDARGRLAAETDAGLPKIPAIVPAAGDDIHLLQAILADVTTPK